MIASHEYKLVFVTTPKSGSHTGFELMRKYFGAEANFNHISKVPYEYRDYNSFSFVRNPYERFCALYHACVVNDVKLFVPTYARTSILKYGEWLAGLNQHFAIRKDLTVRQSKWHEYSGVKTFVQIERAQETFNEWYPELKIVMPHELKREHPTWKDVNTSELKECVLKWAKSDFERFGYDENYTG